jgi:hypothetical protein
MRGKLIECLDLEPGNWAWILCWVPFVGHDIVSNEEMGIEDE